MDFSWFLQELVGEAASIKCGFPQTGNGKHSQWASDMWRLPSLVWSRRGKQTMRTEIIENN